MRRSAMKPLALRCCVDRAEKRGRRRRARSLRRLVIQPQRCNTFPQQHQRLGEEIGFASFFFFFSLLKEFTNWGEFLDYWNLWCFETETFRGKNSPFFRKSERPPWNLFFYFFNCCSSWDPSTYLHISIFKSNQQSGKLQIEMGAIFIGPERLKTWLRPI